MRGEYRDDRIMSQLLHNQRGNTTGRGIQRMRKMHR